MKRAILLGLFLAVLIPSDAVANGDFPIKVVRTIPKDPVTGKYTYQEVIPIEGVTSSELYSRAKSFMATAYRSAKDVIQLDDAAAGRIIGKGNSTISVLLTSVTIWHTLIIEVKDGRYRYTMTDFLYSKGPFEFPLEDEKKIDPPRAKRIEQVADGCEEIIADLKKAMASPSPAGKDDF